MVNIQTYIDCQAIILPFGLTYSGKKDYIENVQLNSEILVDPSQGI